MARQARPVPVCDACRYAVGEAQINQIVYEGQELSVCRNPVACRERATQSGIYGGQA